MKKLVFINACIRREESRTLSIARKLLAVLQKRYDITEIDLTQSTLSPVTHTLYQQRNAGEITDSTGKDYAELIVDADRIVVAAPFWDMSFPSVLKVFFENVSIPEITFKNNADGSTYGNCKAEKMLYITTRGMNIPTDAPLDQGTAYLRALNWLWGIDELYTVAACGMDITSIDSEQALNRAIDEGLKICEEF